MSSPIRELPSPPTQNTGSHPALPPQPFWSKDWHYAQKSLITLRRSMASLRSSPLPIMRVSQLDAELLDLDMFGLLKEQLWAGLSLLKPAFKETFEPELVAVLQLVLFRLSVYDSDATYGEQLQNLKYRNERKHKGSRESSFRDEPLTLFQKTAFGTVTIGGQYIWTRLNRIITVQGWGELPDSNIRKIVWNMLQKGESLFKILTLMNFLVFLLNGRYRSLIERVLSMRLVYATKSMSRQVSFEFLNRQMVWHAFTEFLLFLMPLINLEKLKLRLSRLLLPRSLTSSVSLGYANLPSRICAICHENNTAASAPLGAYSTDTTAVHNPYSTNCGHVYCYWCIKAKIIVFEGDWNCLRCGERVTSIGKYVDKAEDVREDEGNDRGSEVEEK